MCLGAGYKIEAACRQIVPRFKVGGGPLGLAEQTPRVLRLRASGRSPRPSPRKKAEGLARGGERNQPTEAITISGEITGGISVSINDDVYTLDVTMASGTVSSDETECSGGLTIAEGHTGTVSFDLSASGSATETTLESGEFAMTYAEGSAVCGTVDGKTGACPISGDIDNPTLGAPCTAE